MPNGNELIVRVRVATDDDLASTEWISVFECVNSFSQAFAIDALRSLLLHLQIQDAIRDEIIDSAWHGFPSHIAPANIIDIRRGSWEVYAAIAAPIAISLLTQVLSPILQEAFKDSNLHKRLSGFLQSDIFGGARIVAEQQAEAEPRYGNLEVKRIDDTNMAMIPADPSAPGEIRIELQRTGIVPVRLTDTDLINEFEAKLRRHQ